MRSLLLASLLASACLTACEDKHAGPQAPPPVASAIAVAAPSARLFDPGQLNVFAPLPASIARPDNPLTPEKVALGRMLWFDLRLSKGQDVSCNSCHDVTKSGAAGADAPAVSSGTKRQKGTRNAPTVFNAAGNFAQGWDGRASLIEEMVVPHAAEPTTMGSDEKRLLETVASIPGYAASFKKVFPEAKVAVTAETVAMALGAYARKLLTPSRWDRFLGGDEVALTSEEKAGLGAFMDASCTTCHAGKYLGGAQYQKLGVAKAWSTATDTGRFEITKQEVDRGVFKVPTLRNVTRTGPYLHDGSIASLEEITKLMARHQVGRELTDIQTRAIVAFFGALAGEPPKELVEKPELPPSGPKTPKPD